jgi:phage pi2 protein 07
MKGGIKLLKDQQEFKKVWWNMKDLEEATGYKEDWLKENILLQPSFKNILDLDNGGFVYYPEKRGQKWLFIASRMQEFLEKQFVKIFGKSN